MRDGALPVAWSEQISLKNDIFETIFLGLRMTCGLNLERFRQRFGASLEEIYPGVPEMLIDKGLLEPRGKCLRLTAAGLAVANVVMSEFAPS